MNELKSPKSLLHAGLHKTGYRILILMTAGGQWQVETIDLSISNVPISNILVV